MTGTVTSKKAPRGAKGSHRFLGLGCSGLLMGSKEGVGSAEVFWPGDARLAVNAPTLYRVPVDLALVGNFH
jgi:hypothetical protein